MTNGANHAGAHYRWGSGWVDLHGGAQGDYIALSIGEVLESEIDPLFVPWIRLLGPNGDLISSAQGDTRHADCRQRATQRVVHRCRIRQCDQPGNHRISITTS